MTIDRLWPSPAEALDDDAVGEAYAFPDGRGGTWLRANFIASIDGAVTRDGRSGGLGDDADHRVFDLLRRDADAIIVAAGTVRTEGYGAMRLPEAHARWREARGLAPHPVFVLVTRSLDLDPESEVFTKAPVRPIVYTMEGAPQARRSALEAVADVVPAGEGGVDPHLMRGDLAARGLMRLHSEGGPHFLGALVEAGAVDEICLTVAPTLEGGRAGRIATAPEAAPRDMDLAAVLRSGSELFLRYVRAAGPRR